MLITSYLSLIFNIEELDENEEEKEKEYFDEELFDDDGEDIDLGDEQYFD